MSDNLVRKTIDFGLGLAVYSKEKIEELVEEMVKRGEVANKDARKVADELIEKGKAGRDEIQKLISSEVDKALTKVGLKDEAARKSELERMVREQVEAALAAREAGVNTGEATTDAGCSGCSPASDDTVTKSTAADQPAGSETGM